jgi:hypothetical protein
MFAGSETMCLDVNCVSELVYLPPPPLPHTYAHIHHLNISTEADRRKTFEHWSVQFMDPNEKAAGGFYFRNRGDVVCCAFCEMEIEQWEKDDDPFREHQR